MLSDINLHQLIDKLTRPGDNATIIDHIVTNVDDLQGRWVVVPVDVSDHNMVTLQTHLPRSRNQPHTATARSLRNVNFDHLRLEASCTMLIYLGKTEFYLIRLKRGHNQKMDLSSECLELLPLNPLAVSSDILNNVVRYFDYSSVIFID